jgi:peptidoglycan/LPS O-acetylase OafA/YrhL
VARDSPAFRSVAPKLGFVAPLDGLRGFGIAVVVLGHASGDRIQGFLSIIDCFFILSGFLIVTLLLQEQRSTGGVDFRKFYSRRAVRLLPALWVNLVFWLLVGVVAELAGKHYLTDIGKNVAASFLYVYHLFFPVSMELIRGVPAGHDAERVLSPLWTLSIEEHFYLVVPLLVVFAMKRNLVKTLAATLAAIWLGINVHRLLGYTGPLMDPTAPAFVRLMWMARPEALLVGSALALVNAHIPESFTDRHRKVLLPVGATALVAWLLSMQTSHTLIRDHISTWFYWPLAPRIGSLDSYGNGPVDDRWYYFRFNHFLSQALFLVAIFAILRYRDWWAPRLFSVKPLTFLGRLSYTLYIWHSVPIVLVKLVAPDLNWVATTAFVGVASVALALPIYRFVELPVLGMKLRFSAEKETLDLRTGKVIATPGQDGDNTSAGAPPPSGP